MRLCITAATLLVVFACQIPMVGGNTGASANGAPQLIGNSMIMRGMNSYIFGGLNKSATVPGNAMYELDFNTRVWSLVTPNSPDVPPGRMFHAATITSDQRRMIIYGGLACFNRIQMTSLEKGLTEFHMQQDSLEYSFGMEDIWSYDFVTKMWAELSPQRYSRAPKCPTAQGVSILSGSAVLTAPLAWLLTVAGCLTFWSL